MLGNRAVGAWPSGWLCALGVHDTVNSRLLRHALAPSVRSWRLWRVDCSASTVPNTPHIVTRDDLGESSRFDVTDFDETDVEEEDVWWVPGNVFRRALPLNCLYATTRVSMTVHVQPKLCSYEIRDGHDSRTMCVPS